MLPKLFSEAFFIMKKKWKRKGTIFFLICGLLAMWGFFLEPSSIRQTQIESKKWKLNPLRIVFFSDLHVGSPFVTLGAVDNLVKRINALSPDLILIGGDLLINGVLGGTFQSIELVAPILTRLKARLGTFAVLGNHDWWNNGPHIQIILEQHGIRVLENQSQKFVQDNGAEWFLIGIGDQMTGHSNLKKAFFNVPKAASKVVFMHDPGSLLESPPAFDVAMAGHLHGGQVYIPGWGAPITPGHAPTSWAQGWVELPLGRLYVSNGIGTSILPVRIGAPPEFVVLDLGDFETN